MEMLNNPGKRHFQPHVSRSTWSFLPSSTRTIPLFSAIRSGGIAENRPSGGAVMQPDTESE
ncbi:hypothetical protein [Erwinia amylovora]|uniref:hypothetical protein n=1 Tax=Erwinia amylovora TaxID=552 RepID=UPI0020BFEF49|nr:hypothetical protein [Erwinia amylovora]MCK8417619.1 hypothetical protein [Erwinia amylovora]